MYFVGQCHDLPWIPSMKSKATDTLRKHVLKSVQKLTTGEDVFVFGGIVRRTIFANKKTKEYSSDPAFFTEPQPVDCFVDQRADIDIRVRSTDDLKMIKDQLTKDFQVTTRTFDNKYNGCEVHRLTIQVHHSLLPFPVKVCVDLVNPDMNSSRPLLPDFDVNQLQICMRTGQLTLSTPPELHWMLRHGNISFLGGEKSDFFIIQQIHEQIYEQNAKMMLLSQNTFKEMFKVGSKEYYQYLCRMLHWRLPKMLKDGWTISNVVEMVHCDVSLLNSEFRFNENCIEMQCTHCKMYITCFEDFCYE
jgi:hypothetical protein